MHTKRDRQKRPVDMEKRPTKETYKTEIDPTKEKYAHEKRPTVSDRESRYPHHDS